MLVNTTTKHKSKLALAVSLALTLGATSTVVHADERESLEQLKATTTNLIDLLVQEGVLSKDKADAIVKKATEDAAQQVKQAKAKEAKEAAAANGDAVAEAATPQDDKSVRVQYVPDHIKKEMRAEIEKDVMEKLHYKAGERLEMPAWIDRVGFTGDIRLRYQNDNFSKNNSSIAVLNNPSRFSGILNSSDERQRLRVRATLGADVKVNDWLVGGMRFVTGLLNTPVTPNQTEGIAQGKYVFGLDRAFLRANPKSWLMVEGGRFANPFLYTDMLWDPDLAFDGVATQFTPKLTDSLTSFTTLGAFPIEEIQSSEINRAKDKWIYSVQSGIQWNAPNKSTAKIALAYHDFTNVEGQPNPTGTGIYNATVPVWRQKGNNTFDIDARNGGNSGCAIGTSCRYGLASKFRLVNAIGQLDLMTFDPVHVTLTGDYVKNIGFDQAEILRRTGSTFKDETEAYNLMVAVGSNTNFFAPASQREVKKGDWNASFSYKRIEADSVLDGYTDSNFGLGGTDVKGYVLSANYGLDKNTWISGRYLSTDSISGPNLSIDVFLLDFTAKF